ncbi:PDDEXK nuclease domain-containing protein [Pelagibacteraceae bacterium]|nr:PDDEXK nuclease domain-containing protein [Pelagibacteraceae bacterium]|tara:strand:+ start:1646 stop:2560 length:915 start_codon:yes stop_codon:yes gene_type:complete
MNNINEILNSFILQSKTDNLKWSSYPKEYLDLNMKVSFGQGVPARVSWISFLAPEMQTSNGFYPVYLFYKKENKLILAYGISETAEYPQTWPDEVVNNNKKINEYIDNPARYGDSFLFKSYAPSINSNKVEFVNDDNQKLSNDIIENDLKYIINSYKKFVSMEIKNESSPISQGVFYLEKQLEDFIIENWDRTEFGKKYDLIEEEGRVISQQYPTSIGRIDILATDKKTKNYVVIELKKNQTSDDTIGQLSRYMGWVKQELKDDNVKGIIVAGKFDEKLKYAKTMLPNSEAFLYEVDFKIKEYK